MPVKHKRKLEVRHWSEKATDEMEFHEFLRWSEQYVLQQFMNGGMQDMKHAIQDVVIAQKHNTVFGGSKK